MERGQRIVEIIDVSEDRKRAALIEERDKLLQRISEINKLLGDD